MSCSIFFSASINVPCFTRSKFVIFIPSLTWRILMILYISTSFGKLKFRTSAILWFYIPDIFVLPKDPRAVTGCRRFTLGWLKQGLNTIFYKKNRLLIFSHCNPRTWFVLYTFVRLFQQCGAIPLNAIAWSMLVICSHPPIQLLLLSTALQLLVQSFGLLNHFHFLPSSSILDKGLPIWHFQLLYILFNIILPAYLWSSCWLLWNGFPGVYCFDHSCFLHSFDMTIPS